MRIFLLFAGLLVAVAAAGRDAEQTVNLGGGKVVVLTLPEGWKFSPVSVPEGVAHGSQTFQLTPDNGANATMLVRVGLAQPGASFDHDSLRAALEEDARPMVADSVEKKIVLVEFKSPRGFGYLASFTDSKLVGKPPETGNYKTVTSVLLALPEQVAVKATLLNDDLEGSEQAVMLGVLRSLDVRTTSDRI